MSRVSSPEFEGGTLEEYMYTRNYAGKRSTLIKKIVKRLASIWKLRLLNEDW